MDEVKVFDVFKANPPAQPKSKMYLVARRVEISGYSGEAKLIIDVIFNAVSNTDRTTTTLHYMAEEIIPPYKNFNVYDRMIRTIQSDLINKCLREFLGGLPSFAFDGVVRFEETTLDGKPDGKPIARDEVTYANTTP